MRNCEEKKYPATYCHQFRIIKRKIVDARICKSFEKKRTIRKQ